MQIVDIGSGPVIVLIPGVQGRWEWMRPAVDALARRCRVITFSLGDEASFGDHSGCSRFDDYVEQVRTVLDARGVHDAVICGVSYGGLIAATFAARYPDRTRAIALVSAISPRWRPDARVQFLLRAPRLLSPLFCIGSLRMYPEISAAAGGGLPALHLAVAHAWNVVRHMFSPTRMARRARWTVNAGLTMDRLRIDRPALIVTGEESLDRVVPVSMTREYLQIYPEARVAVIERTGHLGLITRSDEFARIVGSFVDEVQESTERRRRLG